ncbi:hypothetical protein PENTCL1PPCAC_12159 [Pristionchus entomophagus]|uniref:Uncharacterized protein n=1 Tax=Pristionchus entomophagus TaxID=358040 RepID=A0AAV5T315_9BILA|nr:hypothetical protein PENTCL1PPCAC_12157 [Pristionchus entomophagus]GMS89984.1 hypothetical protein PENTCL1PPCAC_12159 [Pristionchus entomophagus]
MSQIDTWNTSLELCESHYLLPLPSIRTSTSVTGNSSSILSLNFSHTAIISSLPFFDLSTHV